MSNIILAFPLFSIISCFVGAVLSSFLNKKQAYIVSIIVCLVVASLSAVTLTYCLINDKSYIYTMGHFDPNEDGIRICNEIRFGPLETFLSLFFAIVLLLANIGGKKYQDKDIDGKKQNLFYVMINLILVSCVSLIYTNDIFTGFVFLEVSTLASCGCLMVKEKGPTILATVRYMIFNLVGSGLFLIGIVILYNLTGYLSIENIATALLAMDKLSISCLTGMSLVVLGLSVKSGLFPFHFWMPDAYGCATPTASSLLSGIVTKGYIILLIKVIYRMFTLQLVSQTYILEVLFVLGVLGMIIGSINAINQKSIDRMIAFSSAAQIGYIFMGIGLGFEFAIATAIFHILTHAISKPLLFISSRNLSESVGDCKKFRNLRGAGRVDKFNGVAFSIGALSMVGIPLFAGFMSKYYFVESTMIKGISSWMGILSLIALLLSTILNAIYFARTMITIYYPLNCGAIITKNKPNIWCYIGVSGLAILNIALCLFASPIMDLLNKGVMLFA